MIRRSDQGVPVLERLARHATHTRPEAGDYLETPGGPRRIGHVFGGGFALAHEGGRYELGPDGTLEHSGALHGPTRAALVDTGRRMDGAAWVFGPDHTPKAVTVSVRIWTVEDADVTGI